MESRREVISAVAERYRAAAREDKQKILDEFVRVTGFHRKHAIRALKKGVADPGTEPRLTRSRIYDQAVVEGLTMLWEAADRICGKRLKQAIPELVEAMERHGHLKLAPEIRQLILSVSAATIDRLLTPAREGGKENRRRNGISTPLRKSIAVRTYSDWNDPPPAFFEMDMVAHCGKSVAGSYIHSLVLTDIASGWTVAAPMMMREQTVVTVTSIDLEQVRHAQHASRMQDAHLGLSDDGGKVFIKEMAHNAYLGQIGAECAEKGQDCILTHERCFCPAGCQGASEHDRIGPGGKSKSKQKV